MCYTGEASFTSFVIGSISSIILTYYNSVGGLFFLYVGLMQLYDLIFWMNHSKNALNFWTTKIAMMSNNMQPIVLALLIIFLGKKHLNPFTWGLLALYTVIIIPYSIYAWRKIKYTMVEAISAPSLFWEWNFLKGSTFVYCLYLLLVLVLCWNGFSWPLNWILVSIVLLSYILSLYLFKGKTCLGRFWCYFAAFLPLGLVVIIQFLKRK